MNKTISINISGLVFYIEEGAFDILKSYLDSIKDYFSNQKGGSDIVADIEARIAELFQEKVNEEKTAITLEDVNQVIAGLGQPQDMMDEEDVEDNLDSDSGQTHAADPGEKRLFRDPDSKLLGGVCSGLGAYFGVDPVWLRLAFVLLVWMGGSGVLLYVILWVVIPEASSTADKLKMRGKPINVNNIEESIRKGAQDLEDGISEFIHDPKKKAKFKRGTEKAQSSIQKLVDAVVQLVVLVIKFVAKFGAVILAIFGILVVASVGMFLMTGIVFNDYGTLILPGGMHSVILIVAISLIVLVPVLVLLIRLFQLGLKQGKLAKSVLLGAFLLWVLSIGTAVAETFGVMVNFTNEASIEYEHDIEQPSIDRLYIKSVNSSRPSHYNDDRFFVFSNDGMYFEDGAFYYQNVDFKTTRSNDSDFHIILQQHSQGRDRTDAEENAERIEYELVSMDSVLTLSSFIAIDEGPWRAQRLTVILQVPEGKEVVFMNYLYGIDNHTPVYREVGHDYANRVFKMTASGLKYQPVGTPLSSDSGMISYDYGSFSKVDIQSEREIRVEIVEGSQYKVLVDQDIDGRKGFRIYKDSRTLKVQLNDLWTNSLPDVPIHVKIECPDVYEINCAGQPECVVHANQGGSMRMELYGTSKATFKGNVDVFDLRVAGMADVDLSGTSRHADIDLTGNSSVHAYEFYVERMDVDLKGTCNAEVHVTDYLEADLTGASNLKYKGSPVINQDVSGVSKIRSENIKEAL